MKTAEAFHVIIKTDLLSLRNEITAFENENQIWKVLPGTTNSAGVLFVHLTRSLRHFIGSSFADTGYLRQRDEEFMVRNIPLTEMLAEFETLQKEVDRAFEKIKDIDLDLDFPLSWRQGKYYPTHFMLARMIAHINYHMGQINYHRRFFGAQHQQ